MNWDIRRIKNAVLKLRYMRYVSLLIGLYLYGIRLNAFKNDGLVYKRGRKMDFFKIV